MFTDGVAELPDGTLSIHKLPSTPDDPGRAVTRCERALAGGRPVAAVIHGSTVATNAFLEGRLGSVGLVVNRGFEDVLARVDAGLARADAVRDEKVKVLRSLRLGGGLELDAIKAGVHLLAGWEDRNFLGGLRNHVEPDEQERHHQRRRGPKRPSPHPPNDDQRQNRCHHHSAGNGDAVGRGQCA